MITVPQALALASQHHHAGRLADAEMLYRQILTVQPAHATALHLLGIVDLQCGRYEAAVHCLRQAVAFQPENTHAHNDLGNLLKDLGRLDEAIAAYRHALHFQPAYAEASNNLGVALAEAQRWDEALRAYRRAIEIRPDFAVAHYNLGNALQECGQLAEAAAAFRQALQAMPDLAEAHCNLGGVLAELDRPEEAIAECRRALQLKPALVEAHNFLGHAFFAGRDFAAAAEAYRSALRLRPGQVEYLNNLGSALKKQGRLEEAVSAFQQARQHDAHHAETYSNLGDAWHALYQWDAALAACRRALELNPQLPQAHLHLGNVLKSLAQPAEAEAAYRAALALDPQCVEAQNNLGAALADQGRLDDALAAYDRALVLQPGLADVRFNQSLVRLLRDDFAGGLPLYEARWEASTAQPRHFSPPRWDGRPLSGQRVLVYAEQGFGDSIQFVRYAEMIAARGGEVVVECPPTLLDLLRGAKGVREVVSAGTPLPAFDYQAPMLSLPLIFQTHPETIPANVPYLTVDTERRAAWQRRLGPKTARRRVGLVWSGNPRNSQAQRRHLPFEKLAPLHSLGGVDFFNLQYAADARQLAQFPGLSDHTPHLADFADTAAFLMEMDLIVTVDTAVAHLAGALGRPVWTLLAFVADWRWGLAREDSPWYPTMRLFRQPAAGDWEAVIARVATELLHA